MEQDTSQLSFSSLPEDEKSEPSSGGLNIEQVAALSTSIGEEPKMQMIVEQSGKSLAPSLFYPHRTSVCVCVYVCALLAYIYILLVAF